MKCVDGLTTYLWIVSIYVWNSFSNTNTLWATVDFLSAAA